MGSGLAPGANASNDPGGACAAAPSFARTLPRICGAARGHEKQQTERRGKPRDVTLSPPRRALPPSRFLLTAALRVCVCRARRGIVRIARAGRVGGGARRTERHLVGLDGGREAVEGALEVKPKHGGVLHALREAGGER